MRNMRNFWIVLDVDGRKATVKTGPRSKDGGFSLSIYAKEDGKSVRKVGVVGQSLGASLRIEVISGDYKLLTQTFKK